MMMGFLVSHWSHCFRASLQVNEALQAIENNQLMDPQVSKLPRCATAAGWIKGQDEKA